MIETLVLSLGLGFTVAQVLAPLRRWLATSAGVLVARLIEAIAWVVGSPSPIIRQVRIAGALVARS